MKKHALFYSIATFNLILLFSCGSKQLYINGTVKNNLGMIAAINAVDKTNNITWSGKIAKEEFTKVFNNHKNDIDFVISNNDAMALSILENDEVIKSKIPIFGIDGINDALEPIRKGFLAGTIGVNIKYQVPLIINLIDNIYNGVDYLNSLEAYYDQYDEPTKGLLVGPLAIDEDNIAEHQPSKYPTGSVVGSGEFARRKVYVLAPDNSDAIFSNLWKANLDNFGKKNDYQFTLGAAINEVETEVFQKEVKKNTFDAYIVAMNDTSDLSAYIEAIRPTGKPLIFINKRPRDETKMSSYDKVFFVGNSQELMAQKQGLQVAKYFNKRYDKDNIKLIDRNGDRVLGYIVIQGEPGNPGSDKRSTMPISVIENGLKFSL